MDFAAYEGRSFMANNNRVYLYRVKSEDENMKKILKEGRADFFSFSYYSTSCETTHTDAPKDGQAIWYSDIKTHTSSILTGDGVWMRTDCDTF